MKIFITEIDKARLLSLIDDIISSDIDGKDYVKKLEGELMIAQIVGQNQLPDDVVSMNATVLLRIDDVQETVTLVYPEDADVSDNKISVLSPIGTAILGCRKGDIYEWEVNGQISHIEIVDVRRQA